MSTDTHSTGTATDPGKVPHGQPGCGENTEDVALQEIAAAKGEIAKADEEIKQGLHHMEEAEHRLAKAEADLEEAHYHHEIHFFVDGEPVETTHSEWTPNAIIHDFGERDPATNYLVRIKGHHTESFQGKGTIPIKVHEGDRFQIVSVEPCPVSDGSSMVGVDLFVAGLKAMGYQPQVLNGYRDHVVFDYTVETGKRAGEKFRLGLVVPSDFPATAPGQLHVSPRIWPNQGGTAHPAHGISDSQAFQQGAGGDWHCWSRPCR
jgi:hypothetical protein